MYVKIKRKLRVIATLAVIFLVYKIVVLFSESLSSMDVEYGIGNEETTTSITVRHRRVSYDAIINPHVYNFTNITQGCQAKDVYLMILVKCRPDEYFDRQQIRETWGGSQVFDGKRTATVFLLGISDDHRVNARLEQESATYKDIVQENFKDSYLNLTFKTMMGYRWVSEFCHNVSFVVSADSDIMLNTFNLIRRLQDKPLVGYAEGLLRSDFKPIREPGEYDKWITSMELYPESTYPPYFPGSCYVMSSDVAATVFRESKYVRFLPWDDVFFGIVLKRAGIEPKAGKGYGVQLYGNIKKYRAIVRILSRSINVLVAHHENGTDENLAVVWDASTHLSIKRAGQEVSISLYVLSGVAWIGLFCLMAAVGLLIAQIFFKLCYYVLCYQKAETTGKQHKMDAINIPTPNDTDWAPLYTVLYNKI